MAADGDVTQAHPSPEQPVARLVQEALRTRLAAIREHEHGTRSGADPEDLHQMRVSVRRLRAVLAAARGALDEQWANRLRVELRWLGQALGPVRDLDVLLERLRQESADLPDEERAAVETLTSGLVKERRRVMKRMVRALGRRRYAKLLRALEEAAAAGPPATDQELRPLELIRRPYRQARTLAQQADADSADEMLHELRIRAKRLRYAGELVAPHEGPRVRRLVKAATALQEVLGAHQDAVVAEQRVRDLLRHRRDRRGRLHFVAGRLIEREQARRDLARAQWPDAWQRLDRRARKALASADG